MSAPVTHPVPIQDAGECPISIPRRHSHTHGFSMDVPAMKFMEWVVGDACHIKNDTDIEFGHVSPFGNIFFIMMVVIGVILILAVPLIIFLLFHFNKQKHGPDNHSAFVILDVLFVVTVMLLGALTVMLIWNHDELAQTSTYHISSVQKRIDEHAGRVQCLLKKYFPNVTKDSTTEEVDSVLNKALDKIIRTEVEKDHFNWVKKWQVALRKFIKDVHFTNESDVDALKKAQSFLDTSMDPLSTLGQPVYHKKNSTRDLAEPFMDAVGEIINEMSSKLGSEQAQGGYFKHYQHHKSTHMSFSWLSVLTAIAIVLLCLVIRVLFFARAYTRHVQSSSGHVNTSESFPRVIVANKTLFCALVLAVLGALMAFLYIWGAYDGYTVTCHEASADEESYPNATLRLANHSDFIVELSTFLSNCGRGSNFIIAFGIPLFLNDSLMIKYDVDLNIKEGAEEVTKEELKQTVEKYMKNAEALKKQSDEALEAFDLIAKDGFDARKRGELARMYKKLCAVPQKLIPKNKTLLLGKFTKEVRTVFPERNATAFRERARTALNVVRTKKHNCLDLVSLWHNSRKFMYSNLKLSVQGQWLICVFITVLTILLIIATMRLSAVLSSIELSSSSASMSITKDNKTPQTGTFSSQEPANTPADQLVRSQADQGPKSQDLLRSRTQTPSSQGDQPIKSQANQPVQTPASHTPGEANTPKRNIPPDDKKTEKPNAGKKT